MSDQQNKISIFSSVRVWQGVSGGLALALVGVLAFGSPLLGPSAGSVGGFEHNQEKSISAAAQAMLVELIPSGIPQVYGAELGVAYDDISPVDPTKANKTIEELATIDRQVELSGEHKERYIDLLYRQHGGMSCEYCCGARAIIFGNGQKACECAHSYAMRGLTKYLITEHGEAYSDEEILEEVGKWKVLFFPEIHQQKAEVMAQKGMDLDYTLLTANVNRGIEEGGSGGMVGKC